jgi:hypothetical protein
MPPVADGAKSLPAPSPGSRAAGNTLGAAALARYGHMVPLRGTTRLTRYLSTAESTHELPTM